MKWTNALGILLVASSTLQAQEEIRSSESRSFTRDEAEQYALEHSYNTRRYDLERSRAQAIIWENIALGLPQVRSNANLTNNIDIGGQVIEIGGQQQFLQFGVQYASGFGVTVDQLIFDGSYIVALVATEVVEETAENQYEKSVIDIRADVAQAYHLVLTTERSLDIVREDLSYIQQNLSETGALLEQGFVEQSDVDQLDFLLTNLQANEDYLERQVTVARTILKLRMGIPIEETITLTDDIENLMAVAQSGTEILSESFTVEDHIDFRTLQTGIRGQELNLSNERVQWLPKLNAFYSYAYQYQSPQFDVLYTPDDITSFSFPASSVGLSLRWDLFQGGRRIARVQEAKIALEQLEVQREQLSDALQLEYQSARADYEFALNNYLAQTRNVQIAKDIRDRTAIKLSEGVVSSLEFTTAERQYQDALRNQISSAQEALNKRVSLEKTLGKFNLEPTTNSTQE